MTQELLTECYRVVESQLNDADMSLTIGFGTRAWCDATLRLRGRITAPTFDPQYHNQMDSYHLRIDHASRGIVALAACRHYAGAFTGVVRSGALWYEVNAPSDFMTKNILSDDLPRVDDIAFLGGLWVNPDFQGQGIGGALSMINKLTAISKWPDTRWFAATVKEQNFARAKPTGHSYLKEYETSDRVWSGYFPPTEAVETLRLALLKADVLLGRADPRALHLSVPCGELSLNA